jgi:hypothetical protein
MMKQLSIIALLLLFCLAPVLSYAQEEQQTSGNPQLTKAEEREARNLVAEFMKQLREKKDFRPLTDKFFVPGFIERGRKFFTAEHFDGMVEQKTLDELSNDECYQIYLLMVNGVLEYLMLRYSLNAYPETPHTEQIDDAELYKLNEKRKKQLLRDALTPEFWTVTQSDPLLGELESLVTDTEQQSYKSEEEIKAAMAVKNVARIRFLLSQGEKILKLLRTANIYVIDRIHSEHGAEAANEAIAASDFIYETDDDEDFGTETLPGKEEAITLQAGCFYFYLVRHQGAFKLLGVVPFIG